MLLIANSMGETAQYTNFDPSSNPKLLAEKISSVALHVRQEKPEKLSEEIKAYLTEALLFLHIERAHEVISKLEQAIAGGNHDLVHDFLVDISKMRYSEFAQELLQSAVRSRHTGPGLVLNRNLGRVGRQVIGFAED